MKSALRCTPVLLAALFCFPSNAADTVPTDIQQPGTQPGEISNLESPDKCDNCHGGYNSAVEPAYNWRGSMMAHAGRDPIFWATMAIAEQDFNGSGDLCLRCHSTAGWLAGHSTPTDGSGLLAGDADGVDCDYCHKLTNPDESEHVGVMNSPFIANDGSEGYLGSGMSSMWDGNEKLGPYTDAEPKHQFMASSFHRSVDFCGTCHDVSNPAVGDLAHNHGMLAQSDPLIEGPGQPGGAVEEKVAFKYAPYRYGVVERTFSEYKAGKISQTKVEDYPGLPPDLQGGVLEAIYQAATAHNTDPNYEDGTPRYYSCQSCHMRPVQGVAANKRGIPVRRDLPLHDMTGGNYWMPEVIEYLDSQGKLRLGGDMSADLISAMRDGALRARQQLELAATLSVSGNTLKIVNHTGHKLISGYPEGRRMWLNMKWFDAAGNLLREDGEYGELPLQMDLDGDGNNDTVRTIIDLGGSDTRIYEAHYGLTSEWANQLLGLGYAASTPVGFDRETGAVESTLGDVAGQAAGTHHESFHFVLNNAVVKDNRIPPFAMEREVARLRNTLPVPADQYNGASGTYNYWDELTLSPPAGADYATIDLLYQPTSWEYIQFLYLANNGQNAFLASEGKNMLEAWLATGMAEPHVMASVSWGNAGSGCDLPPPVLMSAMPGNGEISLTWEGSPDAISYNLYYDQADKSQEIIQLSCSEGNCTEYTDTGLTNEQEYCYKVSYETAQCEATDSNILCATPKAPGQENFVGVATPLTTGKWVSSGKGRKATTEFIITSNFAPGDAVVIRGSADSDDGPVSGANVSLEIRDSSGARVATSIAAPSDQAGLFEAVWQTQKPNKKGNGGTPVGSYTAVITFVDAVGYSWDGVQTSVSFILQ